jgi:diguanylate cyclase (GGDEF)-like protein
LGKQLSPTRTELLRRRFSLSYRARANAAQAVQALTGKANHADALTLHAAELAQLTRHPGGLTKAKAAARLGTAVWEVFPGHIALLDPDAVVISVNRAWRQFALANGGTATAGLGLNYLELCQHAADAGEADAAEAARLVRAALSGGGDVRRIAYPVQSRTGQQWFSMRAIPIPGVASGALVIHEDITAEKELETELRHRAFHDPLTGLPNRALLIDRLEHAVAGAIRDPRSLAVLFVDLDDFKSVNDRFGHLVGDEVLHTAAQAMASSVRVSDTVGRWGGDEFVIIAERLDADFTVDELVGRLIDSLMQPVEVGGELLRMRASIGVARLEEHQTAERLVAAADEALIAERLRRRGKILHAEI